MSPDGFISLEGLVIDTGPTTSTKSGQLRQVIVLELNKVKSCSACATVYNGDTGKLVPGDRIRARCQPSAEQRGVNHVWTQFLNARQIDIISRSPNAPRS